MQEQQVGCTFSDNQSQRCIQQSEFGKDTMGYMTCQGQDVVTGGKDGPSHQAHSILSLLVYQIPQSYVYTAF